MTYQDYIKAVKNYIIDNDFDFVFEMAATDTTTIDTIAENMADEIAALYPDDSDSDTNRDNLIKAVYYIIRNDHGDEIKKGALIQDITRAVIDTGVNIWDLYDELETLTIDELEKVKKGVLK